MLCDPIDDSMPGFPVFLYLPEFAQIHVHWVGGAIHSSHPLSLPAPTAFSLSQVQDLSQWICSSHKVAKVVEFQLQQQYFQWIFQLISFRMDGFDLLSVWGTLKSLLQHHGSKASILQCSAFFMVQLWHLYMTTRKTIALTIWAFVSKAMSLLFDTLSRLGLS